MIDIVQQSQANLVGCGIVIEKGFQNGGQIIRQKGIRLESLAIIDSIENNRNVALQWRQFQSQRFQLLRFL